jgi:hypothetical protein
VAGGIGLIAGLGFRSGVTSPGEDGIFTLFIGALLAIVIVVTAVAIAVVQRRADHLPAAVVFFVAAGVAGALGPESPEAEHRAQGTATLSTVPPDASWAGPVTCVWQAGAVSRVSAVDPVDGGYDVHLGLYNAPGGASPDQQGVLAIGASARFDTEQAPLTAARISPAHDSGSVTSFAFAPAGGFISTGPFAGHAVTLEWSCARPERSSTPSL